MRILSRNWLRAIRALLHYSMLGSVLDRSRSFFLPWWPPYALSMIAVLTGEQTCAYPASTLISGFFPGIYANYFEAFPSVLMEFWLNGVCSFLLASIKGTIEFTSFQESRLLIGSQLPRPMGGEASYDSPSCRN